MGRVKFLFEQEDLEPVVVENAPANLSILDIAEDNGVHLNHNCGAVCACSTCHVYIEQGEEHLAEISDREEDFIDRAINPRLESRLGCQCVLQNFDAEIEVTIPDQRLIIGHEH